MATQEYSRRVQFIHYGHSRFDPKRFQPIRNGLHSWCKPHGGLWASPVNSAWGWREWCKAENFKTCRKRTSFTFALASTARLYTINAYADLLALPISSAHWMHHWFDFEAMCNTYDAILLTEAGEQATRLTFPLNFYGWDCECLLVLNPDVVQTESLR